MLAMEVGGALLLLAIGLVLVAGGIAVANYSRRRKMITPRRVDGREDVPAGAGGPAEPTGRERGDHAPVDSGTR